MGRSVAGALGACLLAACGSGNPLAPDGRMAAGLDAAAATDAAGRADAGVTPGGAAFALGIEYTERGLAGPFGEAGVTWAKTRLEAFAWGQVEPEAPVGATHLYDWVCTDALVAEYQQAGMVNLISYLSPESPWGSRGANDPMPAPERMADYRAWVRALVERYDGDGVDDMPGLVAPVRRWVIGGEWTGFWGTADEADYLALLTATREEVRAADPAVPVGLIPFMMFDVFEGNQPTDEEIEQRLADPPPAWRKSTAGMRSLLDHPELFDFIDIHSLGDYTEIPPTLRWLRAEMAARGYSRPIWFDDAFPISFLANYRPTPDFGWPAVYPVTEAIYQDVYDLLVSIARFEGDVAAARAWLRAQAAAGAVKKAVTALGEGAGGIMIGNTEDWMDDSSPALRHATMNFLGASAMMGMIDVTHGGGYAQCQVRTPGPARPALIALQQVASVIGEGGFDSVTRLATPEAPTVHAWQLRAADRFWWIAWNEDDLLQLPPVGETPVTVELPVPAGLVVGQVTVVATVTDEQDLEPVATTLPNDGGTVTLDLTSVPVFVTAAP